MTPVPHTPYLPYVALSKLFMFPWMKKVLRGKCFAKVETAEALKSTEIDEFKTGFELWKKRLDRCIASNAAYFEGD